MKNHRTRGRAAFVSVLAIAAVAAALSGCSADPQPYAEAYRNALDRRQGTAQVTPAMTERFLRFFSHSEAGATDAVDPAQLYGEPLYFSDTLLTTDDRAAAIAHLRRMRRAAQDMQVTVIDRQIDGQDAYLIWQMQATFEPVASAVHSNTLGMTHLRFDDQGRIILQQDFWDSAEGLYQHVPVLGGLINLVKGRFEAP